ncbi:MAG TPA: HAD-IIIC family phosphatase [Phycisphaerae bacterium]|nr:HAD-IIIC family phosphatase [Phycisphaerae bacterium]
MTSKSEPARVFTAAEAQALLAEVNAHPTLIRIAGAMQQLEPLRKAVERLSLRAACISSFTFEPIKPSLQLQALRAGLGLEVYLGPFGQVEQELINPSSGLATFNPDVVFVAARLQDACPAIYEAFNSLTPGAATALVDDWIARLRAALSAFRQRSKTPVFIQNYDFPAVPALGLAEQSAALSQAAVISRANAELSGLAASFDNVRVMDYDALVARHGRLHWQDPRTAFYARIPVAPANYWHLAGFYARHLRPLYGLSKKVLVLDADNTLWGGVVGDVGLDGIALGHDFPGNAFVAFQKRILDLYNRGIVLAIASKNQPGSVEEVLDRHPHMVLRTEHFAAMRIDWEPKPENLRRIAADLNLGIDSFVFMDDSPVECELMRAALPEVLTVHLPDDPARYAGIVESLDCFDQWKISEEDRTRGKLYKAEAGRRELQAGSVDMPTFYRQLQMKVTLFVDHLPHVARAAQMTVRTNQFNMHTIRCSEDDIRRFMAAADSNVFTLALADRFGDNGIVGLAVAQHGPTEWVLHLFLMSCRVLGRTVEQAFIAWIAERARAAGASRLVAEFVPTARNKPFAGFYKDRGLVEGARIGEVQQWVWDLRTADMTVPDWLDVKVV